MRVFAIKWFTKFARGESISDRVLCDAAAEVVAGVFDADLGGSLYKKRVAREGQGKSAGYRLIVGYREPETDRVVFLFGFPKSVADNITSGARDLFSTAAETFIKATDAQVAKLVAEKKYRQLDCEGVPP